MGDGISPDEASFDVYKYRRSVDRNETQLPNMRFSTIDNTSNIYFEVDEQNRHKTYAILHEHRQEFTNTYLRSILLFYSNSAWKIFILFMLFIAYILDSCIYTFFNTNERPLWVILIITGISFAFTFDVTVLLGLKISKRWRKTLNLVEPDTFRVAVNVILAIPFSFFYFINDELINCHAISPIISTLRVYRIVEYFYIRSSQAGCNQWTSFLSQYLILFILGVHTWTCAWYLLSYRGFEIQLVRSSWSLSAMLLPTETTMDWYFVCCYWSVMCLTTNALGDIYPANTSERILASLSVLVGFLLTTVVFVGSLTSQFITITTRRSKYVRRLKKIQNHLRLINMDKDITKRIIRYYEDLWYQKSGVFKPKLLNLLPYPLQMEICYDLNAVPLYASLLFRKLPEAFLRRLSLDMSHQFYLPGDIVYNENQNKNVMICITNGVLELLSDEDNESPMISLAKGTCFGEISLIYNIPSKVTIKAATYVECQVLEKTKFIRLMVTYPDLVDQIRAEIDQRIDRCKRRKQIQGSQTEFTLNVYASKDRKKSSIKCLKDKLRYIQGLTETDNLTEDDILDENCLNLYIISEHIKTKTTTFTCVNSYFPWILEHDCHLVKYWERYMLLIVLYICLVYPYYIGIKREFSAGSLFYTGLLIRISLILNVFMTSVTAVKTKKKYIKDFKGILSYNLNTVGFYLDLISIIPIEYIVTIHTTVRYHDEYRGHLFLMCKGVKLCLVWRLSSFFEKLERKLLLNSLLIKAPVKLAINIFMSLDIKRSVVMCKFWISRTLHAAVSTAKYWIYICLLSYWCGVVLFMESCYVSRCSDNSWFSKALLSDSEKPSDTLTKTEYPLIAGIYFALSVLLSVGYGDFTPGDRYDMGFVAFLSVFGVLLSGYCISEFSAVVTHWLRTKTTFLEVIMTIDKFMKDNNMHPAIKRRIMAFYELQWQYNSGVEVTDENWLQKTIVPSELRKKVLHQARFRALTSIKFFQVKNKSYIHTLTETAREMILPPGEIVYYGGTVTRELYIIESGYCLLTSQDMRIANKERVIGPGNHLGLLVLLYGVPAVSTVITLTHCKLISVSHAAYTSALSLYPDMKEHEGLMKPEELEFIENIAKNQNTDGYLKHYNNILEKKRIKIAGILQEFLNNSFINVSAEYKRNNESYFKSFKEFNILENISPYFLLPIAIRPDGIFLTVWAFSRVMVAFLNCMIIPIVVSMAPLYHVFNIPVIFVEIFCYIDMYLMLHVAFYGKKNQLIYHPYLTAKHYLKGNFLLDFITCFPWYAMLKLLVPSHNEHHTNEDHLVNNHMLHCSLRLINVLQIYKLYAVFAADSLKALKRAYLMSVLHFFLLTLFFLNLYTSILIILTCRYVKSSDEIAFARRLKDLSLEGPYMETVFHPSGNMVCQKGSWIDIAKILKSSEYLSPGTVYLLAYYWTVSSFSGAGFGDVTPQDTKHMVLSICVNVHGVFFFGYVYARIASLKAMSDKVVTKFQENVKHLDMFLNRENVPISLKKTIMEYWKYQWKRTGGWSHQSILGKLHANLNEDAVLYMYEKTLREIPLFENVEFSFFRAFAKKLKELYFQKGYMVIRSNEVIETMYIIFRGKVDIISDINEVEACMGPGGIFGNIRGAKKYLTMSTIIASRNIDVLSIAGRDFYSLLKSYPAVLRKVYRSVESTSKDYVIPTISSERESAELQSSPLTYEPDDGEDDFDVTVYLESPEKSIAESHGSKSITSAGNADFVSAPFLIFLPHRWFRSSIIPDSKLVTFMEYLILCIGYTDFMLLTYQMAFHTVPFFLFMCVTSDAIFLFKVFLDIHCGYMNRYGDYVLNPKMVRNMYFSKVSHRRRDFLANFILCYTSFTLPASMNLKLALFTYMRTPILARITYLFTYSTHRKTNVGSSNLFLKLLSIGIWASILTHVNACLFFKLSCLTPEHCSASNWMTKSDLNLRVEYSERKFFSIYISALWYMINLLTITGTGDVSSQNSFEVIETIIIILIIKFCTGLLISEMSAMMTAHSSSLISYDYGINELRDGLNDTDLSDHQMNKMWEYVRELWNRQQGRQMPELVHQLPFRLRCQVMQAIYGSHIRESVIFSKAGDDFRRMLSMWMKHCVFFPGNYIVQCGDSDQCIYFIHRGQVEVLTVHVNLTESIYDVLGPEDSFGVAQGLFVGVSHHFSFRAQTVVDVVYLKLEKWKYLLDFYPKSAKVIQRKVENVYLAI